MSIVQYVNPMTPINRIFEVSLLRGNFTAISLFPFTVPHRHSDVLLRRNAQPSGDRESATAVECSLESQFWKCHFQINQQ